MTVYGDADYVGFHLTPQQVGEEIAVRMWALKQPQGDPRTADTSGPVAEDSSGWDVYVTEDGMAVISASEDGVVIPLSGCPVDPLAQTELYDTAGVQNPGSSGDSDHFD